VFNFVDSLAEFSVSSWRDSDLAEVLDLLNLEAEQRGILSTLLPVLANLTPDERSRLFGLWDDAEADSLNEFITFLQTYPIKASGGRQSLSLPRRPTAEELWAETVERVVDALTAGGTGLIVENGYGQYVQVIGLADGFLVEVAGPENAEPAAYVYGVRVFTFYTDERRSFITSRGYELDDGSGNFTRVMVDPARIASEIRDVHQLLFESSADSIDIHEI